MTSVELSKPTSIRIPNSTTALADDPTMITTTTTSTTSTTTTTTTTTSPSMTNNNNNNNNNMNSNRSKSKHPHKMHKKKKSQTLSMHSVDTPVICFPYRWKDSVDDEKCINNRQYHLKGQDLPNKMTKAACVSHLLSYQLCCKRFLCAYFLNLKQLQSADGLLNDIMTSANTLVEQLLNEYNHSYGLDNNNNNNNNNDETPSHFKILSGTEKDSNTSFYDSAVVFHHESCLSCTTDLSSVGEHHKINSWELEQSPLTNIETLSKLIENQQEQQQEQQQQQQKKKQKHLHHHNASSKTPKLLKSFSVPGTPTGSPEPRIMDRTYKDTPHIHNSQDNNEIKQNDPLLAASKQITTSTAREIIMKETTLLDEVETQSCPDLQYDYLNLDSNDNNLSSLPSEDEKKNKIQEREQEQEQEQERELSDSDVESDEEFVNTVLTEKYKGDRDKRRKMKKVGNERKKKEWQTQKLDLSNQFSTENEKEEEEKSLRPFTSEQSFDSDSRPKIQIKKPSKLSESYQAIKHHIELLHHWIHYYPSDFSDAVMLTTLMQFVEACQQNTKSIGTLEKRWGRLLQLINRRKPRMKNNILLTSSVSNLRINPKINSSDANFTQYHFTDSFFPPKELVAHLGGSVDLLQIPAKALAEQLTLIDTEIYLQIEIRELTNCAWQNHEHLDSNMLPDADFNTLAVSPFPTDNNSLDSNLLALTNNKNNIRSSVSSNRLSGAGNQLHESPLHKLETSIIDAPNLLYMIDHVNRLSLWVATSILQEKSITKQVEMCKYFYSVANRCLQLNNVHSCTAIFGGICLEPVDRLKQIKKLVFENELMKTYHDGFLCLLSTDKNYRFYRKMLEQWFDGQHIRPCLPFMPVLVKDLFVIQTNLTPKNEKTKEKEVDLKMLEKNCRLIRRFYETQQRSKLYANVITTNVDIQSVIRMSVANHETMEKLRQRSSEIQPRMIKQEFSSQNLTKPAE